MLEVPERPAPPRAVRSFRDPWFLLLAALVLLGVAGAGVYAWRPQVAARTAADAAAAAAHAERETAKLQAGAEVNFSGPVVSRNVLAIPAPINGTVEAVEVQAGSHVEQDQPLARIKNEGLAAAQEAAKAGLEKAAERISTLESSQISARLEASRSAADHERARGDAERSDRALKREEMLFREGATPRLKFERIQQEAAAAAVEAEALRSAVTQASDKVAKITVDLENAKKAMEEKTAALEESKAEIDAATVTAPVDGVLLVVNVKTGDEVKTGGTDLFQIAVAADELAVIIEPTPPVAERLQEGLPVLINLLEIQQDGVSGALKRDDKGKWRAEFKASNPNVKPGLNAVVRVKLP